MIDIDSVEASQSDMKLRMSKHFAIHMMTMDNAFWDLNIKTVVETEKHSYISDIAKRGIVSQRFTASDDGEVFWRIRLICDDPEKKQFKISLDAEFNRKDIDVLVYAVFTDSKKYLFFERMKSQTMKSEQSFHGLVEAPRASALKFPNVVIYSGFDTLRVDVTYAKVEKVGQVKSEPWISPPNINNQVKSLISGIAALLENPIASDVTLRCNGVEWKLHKVILAASSKLFAAMFSGEMKENTENVVDIVDVDNKVLDLMIKFIYNAEIDETEINNAAEELLISADKYDLLALQEKCEDILISQLCVENCLRFFLLGHNYNYVRLRKAAKRIVALNLPELSKTVGYKTFVENNSYLSIEIYQSSIKL